MFNSDEIGQEVIELNKEYDYKGICEALGWEAVEGGGKRQRQLKAVKEAYVWHHPIDSVTGKPKARVYVFTKQVSEIEYCDGRKGNGRKPLLPEADFELLLAYTARKYGLEPTPVDDSTIKVLLFSSHIYRGFGLDVYAALKQLYADLERKNRRNQLVDAVFRSCAVSKAHAFSIRRIASHFEEGSTSLDKEVVSKRDANSSYEKASIEISSIYQETYELWEAVLTGSGKYPISNGTRNGIRLLASSHARDEAMKESDALDIRRANALTIPRSFLMADINEDILTKAQKRYREIVLSAIQKQVDTLQDRVLWGDYPVDDKLKDRLSTYCKMFRALFPNDVGTSL